MGVRSDSYKVSFHYFFSVKDMFYVLVFILLLILARCMVGYSFMDAENFIPANILVTPTHIQPEWYFLFAYAILRAIPNKLGGVVALLMSILVLFMFTINTKNVYFTGRQFRAVGRFLFWSFVGNFLVLTWLGACPAEYPFIGLRQGATVVYFGLVALMLRRTGAWNLVK